MELEDLLPPGWEKSSTKKESVVVVVETESEDLLDFNNYAVSRADKYYEYLNSLEWFEKKSLKLEEVGYRCQLCNSPFNLDVHHRTYVRVPNEPLTDLTVLCRGCHSRFHQNGRTGKWPSWNDIEERRRC